MFNVTSLMMDTPGIRTVDQKVDFINVQGDQFESWIDTPGMQTHDKEDHYINVQGDQFESWMDTPGMQTHDQEDDFTIDEWTNKYE